MDASAPRAQALGPRFRLGGIASVAVLGVVAGAAQLAGAFPWLVGPLPAAIVQAMFALWLVLVGLRLVRPPIGG
jgi:hypothetical protein